MKVLITGGAGFIGSHIVNTLHTQGHEIFVIDNLSKQIHGDAPHQSELYLSIIGKCTLIQQNVEDISDWSVYLDQMDALIHLAAETGTGQSMYEVYHYNKVNSSATASICQYLAQAHTKLKVVSLASSRSVYGEGSYSCIEHGEQSIVERDLALLRKGQFDPVCERCGLVLDAISTSEGHAVQPRSVYALTKYYQEQLLKIMCEAKGINFFGFRLQNVYGPGQSLSNPYTGIMSIFSNLILNNKHINIFEDGLESRDFIYVNDVARLFCESLSHEGVFTGLLNIGTGVPISVLEVVESLSKHYNVPAVYSISGDFRKGDIRHNFASTKKLYSVFGTQKMVQFSEGVRYFCDWVEGQQMTTIDYTGSLAELRQKGMMGSPSD